MSNFKPQVFYRTKESIRDYRNGCSNSEYITKVFSSYRLLKKELKSILDESYDDLINVTRSRRGEWGEWFEHWGLKNGKPSKTKEGWL